MRDEALKINGADNDYHGRDLWDASKAGDFPEWELGLQLFTEEQAAKFDFDVLDPTKLILEELVPLKVVGRFVSVEQRGFPGTTQEAAAAALEATAGFTLVLAGDDVRILGLWTCGRWAWCCTNA
jgi:catalase